MFRRLHGTAFALVILLAGAAGAGEKGLQTAIFAGGCFWCVESDFDKVPGVVDTVSGYIGGDVKNPSYKQVTAGGTGHIEAVKITFDPARISYEMMLDIFWRSVDPTDAGGQFCDRGPSYATAIFATSKAQRRAAVKSKKAIAASKILARPIVTPIRAAGTFYPAEDYHQDYHSRNPVRYKYYRFRCGRDSRVRRLWGSEAYAGIPNS